MGVDPRKTEIVTRAARRYGIKPSILYGLWGAETNFGANTSRSSAGALGDFQFMPATAKSYGIDPFNFRQAANAAAKYLSTYKGRGTAGMLAAYNAGPGGDPNNPETRAYIPRVLQLADAFPGAGGSSGGGGGQQPQLQGPTAQPGQPGFGIQPGPDTAGLLASLLQSEPEQPPVGQLRPSALAARATLPQGYQGIQTTGGPAPRRDLSGLLEAVSGLGATMPGVTQPTAAGDAQNGANAGGGSTKRRGRPGNGLGNAVSLVDGLVGEYGAPITAKQEPGHAAGGDHDPAVKGATARDIGGDEQTRARIFRDLTRRLGVKNAVYKGADINVIVGGVRYQIISRDHGTGPHLHIGLRKVI